MGQSSQLRPFADHDRTRRRLDKARQNRRLRQFPSIVLRCEQRVFVDALERLNYSVESLLGDAGIRRADKRPAATE